MNTVEALKNLAVAVCGVKLKEVTGTTVAEVIQFIADNYKKPSTK